MLLVVLSTLGYTLAGRISAQRHRNHYIIDYQNARYGCDSAVKYALAVLTDINIPPLILRPDEPDFSDLFSLTEVEYKQFLDDWAQWFAESRTIETAEVKSDANDSNDVNDIADVKLHTDANDPNFLRVRGPYGPAWPFIIEPLELDIGAGRVKIEIEDENAKYPASWIVSDETAAAREIQTGFRTFCDWMDVNDMQVIALLKQFRQISEIKSFKFDLKPTKIYEEKAAKDKKSRRRRRRKRTVKTTIPVTVHIGDFARLFHSSLIDTDILARPTVVSENRRESALKYMGMWGSGRVNINTAPRHVLEAAFAFGGDGVEIADGIIRRRQSEPFKDTEELRKSLLEYSGSIEKSKKYITTTSRFFTIRVTATSGVAQASAVIAITKDGEKTEKIAVIGG